MSFASREDFYAASRAWNNLAEILCPAEYEALLSQMSSQSTGKGIYARRQKAREKLDRAMARLGHPYPVDPGPTPNASGIERGARGMARREHGAYERFIEMAMEQHGFTRDEASKILDVYLKHRVIKIDRIGGGFTFTHGGFAERDVMLNALDEANGRKVTPNTGSYYVWPLRTDGTPLESEGPYGPHDLEGAKTYARISATEGKHDRAVSRGVDPTSPSFEIVRRYKAGTGNRIV